MSNIDKILESIDDFFTNNTALWTAPKTSMGKLELCVRQTIGVALKSSKAAVYIEQLMGLEEDVQRDLSAIVENCLASIEDGNSSRSNSHNNSSGNEEQMILLSPHDLRRSTISSVDVDI